MAGSGVGSSWRPEPVAAASYLEFLADDAAGLFSEFLDPQTLSAVCTADPNSQPGPADEATRKRIAADSDDSDDEGKTEAPRDAKRGRTEGLSKDAARTKACREKARREKINERFAELATLIDPGSAPKTDKPSILADAIKHVQQLRVENHQLKQLNKFLEERVAQYERERGQQLYQQSLMMQHGGLMPGLMQHGLHVPGGSLPPLAAPSMPGSSMAGPSGIHGHPTQPLLHSLHAAAAAHAAAHAAHAAASSSSNPHGAQAPHMHLQSTQHQSSSAMPYPPSSSTPPPTGTSVSGGQGQDNAAAVAAASVAAAAAVAGGGSGGKGLFLGLSQQGSAGLAPLPSLPGALPPPQQYWVPPTMLDSNQDSLLRPPAA